MQFRRYAFCNVLSARWCELSQVYSNSQLSNAGWRLETDDALPRATRLVGEYWQPNFEYNPATRLYVMWWIYSKPNTTVGLVQSATANRPGGPYTIVNGNVTLARTRAAHAFFMYSSGLCVFAQHARFKLYVRASSW